MALPKSAATDQLFQSFLTLETLEDCYRYFEDLCTIKEVQAMSQRLEVARLLRAGESYQKVTDDTGVSSATVGRVKRCLDYGTGGYHMILEREDQSK
ncbi:MAG: YerC/YecD family TrpR-related protein [Oscillospiraceae bacterium]|nr:YerC/YecD family TrpR-related protein [Oscillospiraceae bacterium]